MALVRSWRTFAWATLRGALFFAHGSVRLGAQGPHSDELHQAWGAFAYTREGHASYDAVLLGGLPLMNLSCSGAIKTGIYGLYLRATGAPFDLCEWRRLGLLFASVGLTAFVVVARRSLGHAGLTLFGLLLLTEAAPVT